ncbi:MAG: hypothetical protein PWP27_1552 [Clostridiales bacterium]|jgi:putative tricarboxylic transport membrane protein|nr:hypothetical protein [Clostridiales bacterium]MDK2933742.1 hypothetical protein [Clostridiales bacterium]
MINADIIFGSISSLISILFYVVSLSFPKGTTDGIPGPGYFPQLMAVIIFVLSIILIVSGIKNKKRYIVLNEKTSKNVKPLILTIAAMGCFIGLWEFIPFILGAFLYLLILNIIFKQKLKFAVIFAATTTAVIYFIFVNIFHIML